MKKHIVFSLILIIVAGVFASRTEAYSFSGDLSIGSRGQEVAELQTWLITSGYDIPAIMSGSAQKGYFGVQTREALMAYQRSVGLPAYGFFGPLTRSYIIRVPMPVPIPQPHPVPPPLPYPSPFPPVPIPSSVVVIYPNGGETITPGSLQTIRWNTYSSGSSSLINIYLVKNISGCFNLQPGNACLTVVDPEYAIGSNLSDTGSFSWSVGHYDEGSYYIRICRGGDRYSGTCDTSDSTFRIYAGTSGAGPLRIVSPNGGESWQRGTVRNITWTSPYYIRATTADLRLERFYQCTGVICPLMAYAPYTIISGISINQNSYSWNVGSVSSSYPGGPFPGTVPDGQYIVSICETGTGNCESSDSHFTIYSGIYPPTPSYTPLPNCPSGYICHYQ